MIRVGPAGWSYPDWEGIVYPRRKGAGFHPLRHLARYVDCVEINSSFYRTPDASHAERWGAMVEDRADFRFLVKLQNLFTHEALPVRKADLKRTADAFLAGIEPLRRTEILTGLLVQFPFSFHASPEAVRRLEILRGLFGHLPLVLEVRHRSWYEPRALEAIEAQEYSMAHVDLPSARDHPPANAPIVGPLGYLRIHGRNRRAWFQAKAGRDQRYDYLYAPDEIAGLARLARRLANQSDETFVITNNHFRGKAVANALELLAALGDLPPLAPVELIEAFPRLRQITRPDGQQTLF